MTIVKSYKVKKYFNKFREVSIKIRINFRNQENFAMIAMHCHLIEAVRPASRSRL